jgi:L-ribulose-5-phosphate 3-epimerase
MSIALGAVTDEVSLDFNEALAWIRDHGLDYVDLRDLWLAGENISELSDEQIKKAGEALAAYNLPVKTICPALFRALLVPEDVRRLRKNPGLIETDGSQYAEHLRMLKRSLELASLFGAPFVRAFAFFREHNPEEIWNDLLEAFHLPLEMAEQHGKTLLLENEEMSYAVSGSEAAQLIRGLDSRRFRAIWDPANACGHPEAPFPDGYNSVKPYIEVIHAKDAAAGEIVTLGRGHVDWDQQLKALLADGFSGAISIETHTLSTEHTLMEGSEQNLAYLRSRLNPSR